MWWSKQYFNHEVIFIQFLISIQDTFVEVDKKRGKEEKGKKKRKGGREEEKTAKRLCSYVEAIIYLSQF